MDSFSNIERTLRHTLRTEGLPVFLDSSQYSTFCTNLQNERSFSLPEILANATHCSYFERFVAQHRSEEYGSLRFYLDVQSMYAPLVEKEAALSREKYERLQQAVRRIYNRYLAEKAVQCATVVMTSTRAEVLSLILCWQGESYIQSKYASLFVAAQAQVVDWFEKHAYPYVFETLYSKQDKMDLINILMKLERSNRVCPMYF